MPPSTTDQSPVPATDAKAHRSGTGKVKWIVLMSALVALGGVGWVKF